MRVLLDTHTFLWWNTDDPRLSSVAREVIADDRNELYLSVASAWKIATKAARGSLILYRLQTVQFATSRSVHTGREAATRPYS